MPQNQTAAKRQESPVLDPLVSLLAVEGRAIGAVDPNFVQDGPKDAVVEDGNELHIPLSLRPQLVPEDIDAGYGLEEPVAFVRVRRLAKSAQGKNGV